MDGFVKMNEVIEAFQAKCSTQGLIVIIKQILTYKRQFFLAMDKKSRESKFNFTENKKMKPLIMDTTLENGRSVSCVKVTLSERSAALGKKINNEFYSAISRNDLLRLCKVSEVDENFTILFSIGDDSIPVPASELIPVLSKFKLKEAIWNFSNTRIFKSYLVMDAVFLVFLSICLYAGKIKPSMDAARKVRELEARRVSALFSGYRETTEYAENGNLICKITEEPDFHSYKYYDEKGNIIRELSEKDRGFLDIYRKDGFYKRENAIKTERFFEYDKKGNLIHSKGLKKEIFYNFDSHLEFMNESFEDTGDEAWYRYDSRGNRIYAMILDTKTGNNAFDENGNSIDFNDSTTSKTWYEYDGEGKIILEKSSGGTEEGEKITAYEYDETGRLLRKKITSGKEKDETVLEYNYDDDGNLLTIKNSKGGGEEYRYDRNGRVSSYETRNSKGHRDEFKYYNYDDRGNLISFHDNNSKPEDWTYEYNSDNMLIYERGQHTTVEKVVYYEREFWYMYDFYTNGNLKRIVKYFN